MTRLGRFLKLEGRRPSRPARERPARHPRFAEVGAAGEDVAGPERSGGETERFAAAPEPPLEPPIRLRQDDGGQPFVRCRVCHYDNPLDATVCTFCEADLTTPRQRSFNAGLWEAYLQEQAETRQAVDRLEAEQRQLDGEYARLTRELETRRRRGQLDEAGESLWTAWRDAGQEIAGWLVRRFPDRRRRLLILGGVVAAVNLAALWAVLALGTRPTLWLISVAVQLAVILRALHRARRRRCQRSSR